MKKIVFVLVLLAILMRISGLMWVGVVLAIYWHALNKPELSCGNATVRLPYWWFPVSIGKNRISITRIPDVGGDYFGSVIIESRSVPVERFLKKADIKKLIKKRLNSMA